MKCKPKDVPKSLASKHQLSHRRWNSGASNRQMCSLERSLVCRWALGDTLQHHSVVLQAFFLRTTLGLTEWIIANRTSAEKGAICISCQSVRSPICRKMMDGWTLLSEYQLEVITNYDSCQILTSCMNHDSWRRRPRPGLNHVFFSPRWSAIRSRDRETGARDTDSPLTSQSFVNELCTRC